MTIQYSVSYVTHDKLWNHANRVHMNGDTTYDANVGIIYSSHRLNGYILHKVSQKIATVLIREMICAHIKRDLHIAS